MCQTFDNRNIVTISRSCTSSKANEISKDELKELREELQIPITFDYPTLSKELLDIKNNLINSFLKEDFSYLPPIEQERIKEYKKILKESNLRIVLSESSEINACTSVYHEIIIVNKGMIQFLYNQGLGHDGLAFIIGHEISHHLYEKSKLLTDKEKRGLLANHDKEYQCDKDSLTLMDIAGYSTYVAKFDIPYPNKENENATIDMGILNSHPTDVNRNERLREIIECGIWKHYRESNFKAFSVEALKELASIKKISPQLQEVINFFNIQFPKYLQKCFLLFKINSDYNNRISNEEFKEKFPDFYSFICDERSIYSEIFKKYESWITKQKKTKQVLKDNNFDEKNIILSEDINYSMYYFYSYISKFKSTYEFTNFKISELTFEPNRSQCDIDFPYGETIVEKLNNIEHYLPCRYEIFDVTKNGNNFEYPYPSRYLYDLLNNGEYSLFNSYEKEFKCLLEKQNYSSSNSEFNNLIRITKKFISKLGINSQFSPKILKEKAQEIGLFLERVQSKSLLLIIAHHNIELLPLLHKNDWCSNILNEFGFHDITMMNKHERLCYFFDKNKSYNTRQLILDKYLIPEIKNKNINPLELMEILNSIKENGFLHNKSMLLKDVLAGKETFNDNKVMLLKDAIETYTKDDENDVKSFWKEKIYSLGLIPNEYKSLKEFTSILKQVPKDTHISDHKFQISEGDKEIIIIRPGLLKSHWISNLSRFNSEYKSEYTKEEEKNLKLYFYISPAYNIFKNASLNDIKNIEFEDAHILALNGIQLGIEYLESKKYFDNLEYVINYWQNAKPINTLRTNPDYQRFFYPSRENLDEKDVSNDPFIEPIHSNILLKDAIFFIYLKKNDFKNFVFENESSVFKNLEESISWIKENLSNKCEFRDIVLSNIWKINNFEEKLVDRNNQDLFMGYMSLYTENSFRREYIANKIYNAFKDDNLSLNEKTKFILTCFPYSSINRDNIFEEMLRKHLEFSNNSLTLSEIHNITCNYSSYDRKYERNESILDGTLGAIIQDLKPKNKLEIINWIFLNKEKPEIIINKVEIEEAHVNCDFMQKLVIIPSFRQKLIDMLFFGDNGLATDKYFKHFEKFLNEILNDKFNINENDDKRKTQLINFGKSVILTIFKNVNVHKRKKLLNKLFELAQDESKNNIESFLPAWISSYSASAVKLLQIVSSRSEVKELYPNLYQECEKAKSNAEQMSFFDMLKSMYLSEELRNKNYKILEIIGAASIKVVLRAKKKNGKDVVIKILRHDAGKYVTEETEELNKIVNDIKPELDRIWGIKSIPDIASRAAEATLDETNFSKEVNNTEILSNAINEVLLNNQSYEVTTPTVINNISNVIIESCAEGLTLDRYIEEHPEDEEKIQKIIPEIFLKLLNKNIVLADMHQGNIIVKKDEDGKFKFTLIDTGALFKLDDKEAKILKTIMVGIVLSSFKNYKDLIPIIQNQLNLSSNFSKALSSIILTPLVYTSSKVAKTFFKNNLFENRDIILRKCIRELIGEELYKNNCEFINNKMTKILNSTSIISKPLLFLELLDNLKNDDGTNYNVSNSIYWSIIGLTKVYGLTTFNYKNLSLYKEILRDTL